MSRPLVLLVPRVGAPSETFIRAHVNGLAPAPDTSVIAREVVRPSFWTAEPAVTVLNTRRLVPYHSRRWRLAHRLIRIRRQDTPPGADPTALRVLSKALEREPDAAVLAEYLDVWSAVLLKAPVEGHPVVVRAHGYDVSTRVRNPAWSERFRRLADRAMVAVCSEHGRALLIEAGLPEERVVSVPNGVDPGGFDRPERRAPGARFHVLSVGRLVAKKDPRPTIAALRVLRDRGVDATFTVVGEGGLRTDTQQAAVDLGVADHVELVGAVGHDVVKRLLREADAFVQHSVTTATGEEEGMPISVLEAMAGALPVVGTRHAGIPEAIGDCGYLVDPGDVDTLADALIEIAADPGAAAELGRRARARIEDRFSWARERDGLRRLLRLD